MSRDLIRRPTEFREGVFLAHATTTLTGATTLTVSSPMIQFLDPGGADRTVTLPAESVCDGLAMHFYNAADADETLTINDDAAATVATLGRGQAATLRCDGTSWIDFSGGGEGGRAEVNKQTLAANLTLTAASAYFQILDPAADRDVTLPAVAASIGIAYSITNAANALEIITVKNAGATAQFAIGPNMTGVVVSDGVAWQYSLTGRAEAINIETLATRVLTLLEPPTHILDPGGADRTVTLPTEASAIGIRFTVKNSADANELLNVYEDSDTTIQATLGAGMIGEFLSDGTGWHVFIPGDTRGAVNIETLSATHVLAATSPKFQTLDPGGAARDVTLPVAAIALAGLEFRIANAANAAEALTVKDGASTIVVIDQDEIGVLWCDGVTWQGGSLPEA